MTIDLHQKALYLLNILANSVHDREPKNTHPFFFSSNEIHAAEIWLSDFMREIQKGCVCNKD